MKNVCENPGDEKFRRVKCNKDAFKKVSSVRGGEDYLQAAGWRRVVIEYEPCYVLNTTVGQGVVDSLALKLLNDTLLEAEAKKERYDREMWLKKNEDKLRRDAIQREIDGDRERRTEEAARRAAAARTNAAATATITAVAADGSVDGATASTTVVQDTSTIP